MRAKLDNGERVIGIRYPEILIPLVEKQLKEYNSLEEARRQSLVSKLSLTFSLFIYINLEITIGYHALHLKLFADDSVHLVSSCRCRGRHREP